MSTISSEVFSEKQAASNFKTGWFDGSGDGVQQNAVKIEEEDERLIQLGIRRELRKEFTNFSTISFALGILGRVIRQIDTYLGNDCYNSDVPRVLHRR